MSEGGNNQAEVSGGRRRQSGRSRIVIGRRKPGGLATENESNEERSSV